MSTRMVQTCTSSPNACARATRSVGVPSDPSALTGTSSRFSGPMPSAYAAMLFRPSPATIAAPLTSWMSRTSVFARSSRRLSRSNDWMNTGASRRFQPCLVNDASSGSSSGRPDAPKVGRVLGLRIDPDRPPTGAAELLRERDHFVEGRDLKLAVVCVRTEGEPLARAKRLDFRQREVFGEPAGHRLAVDRLGPLAIGKPLARRPSCRRFRSRAAQSARRPSSRRDRAR